MRATARKLVATSGSSSAGREQQTLASSSKRASKRAALLVKQLRFYTRFITVCLLLGKREEVWEYLEKLTELIDQFATEAQVKFKAASIQYVVQTSEDAGTSVTGYFPCDQPPALGLSIPSQSNATTATRQKSKLVSHRSSIFNIAPDQWIAADNGNNNCTAIVTGLDFEGSGSSDWILGQAWFQGKYIDHNSDQGAVGIATLKNKAG